MAALPFCSWTYVVTPLVLLLSIQLSQAADFFCASGDSDCVVTAISDANGLTEDSVITLKDGTYLLPTIQTITSAVVIHATEHSSPAIIQGGAFRVLATGKLTLD